MVYFCFTLVLHNSKEPISSFEADGAESDSSQLLSLSVLLIELLFLKAEPHTELLPAQCVATFFGNAFVFKPKHLIPLCELHKRCWAS